MFLHLIDDLYDIATSPLRFVDLATCCSSNHGGISSFITALSLSIPFNHDSVVANTSKFLSSIHSAISSLFLSSHTNLAFRYPILEHLLTNGLGDGFVVLKVVI